jgi:hypothetical protein
MDKHKDDPEGRKSNKSRTPGIDRLKESRASRLRRRRRRRRWIGTVATGVAITVLAGVVTGAFNDAIHAASKIIFQSRQKSSSVSSAGNVSPLRRGVGPGELLPAVHTPPSANCNWSRNILLMAGRCKHGYFRRGLLRTLIRELNSMMTAVQQIL